MTGLSREAARALLAGDGELTYVHADSIFTAWGCETDSPSYVIEVYYHPRWKARCGAFTARDDGHTLTPVQRRLIQRMLDCIEFHESFT